LDSRVLLGEKSDIERELKNKVPQLMDEGGYIPAIDRPITPDVPFENYKYYVELLRELVGS
jgi:uroporphyrinogen decarboxylase